MILTMLIINLKLLIKHVPEASHNAYQLLHYELLPYTSHIVATAIGAQYVRAFLQHCSAIGLQCQGQICDVNDDNDDDVLMMPLLMILMMLMKKEQEGEDNTDDADNTDDTNDADDADDADDTDDADNTSEASHHASF